jgi:hypothetical protein
LESIIRKLRIQTLKAQLKVCNQVCVALSNDLENLTLTDDQRLSTGHRLDEALKESRALQFMLDLLERQIKEEREHTGSTVPKV